MGLYRSTIHGTQDGQTVDVIMGWLGSDPTDVSNATNIAQRVAQDWQTYLLPQLADDYAITSVDCVGVDNPTVGATYTISDNGSSTTLPLPVFVVANVHLITGVRGRSYTGRFGIPGLTTDYVDNANPNYLDSAAQTTLQTAVGDFISHVETGYGAIKLAVVSTISGGTPRTPPIGTDVTTAEVRSAFGSRVSRKA